MAASFAESTIIRCHRCGAEETRLVWLAIDLVERPELREMIASGRWLRTTCGVCGASVERDSPLLVIRLCPAAPLLFGLPRARFADADPIAPHQALIDGVRERLGVALRDVPGPLLAVPHEVIVLAAARDVEADVRGPECVSRELGDEDRAAKNYVLFLGDVRDSTLTRRCERAIGLLWELRSAEDLAQLVADYPEITTREVADAVAERAHDGPADVKALASAQLELLSRVASGDIAGAWSSYKQAIVLVTAHLVPEIEELQARFDECEAADDFTGAVEAGEALLEIFVGNPAPEAEVAANLAAVLLKSREAGRAERIERAIELLRRTLELYDAEPEVRDHVDRPGVVSNLGYAFSDRFYGDPFANQERAIERYREVLDLVTIDSDGDTWAMSHTNLGLGLLECARADSGNEFEWRRADDAHDTDADLAEAISHFEAALRWRSFERDPRDWAFTQINLGVAYRQRTGGSRRDNVRRALEHYLKAERGYAVAGDRINHAQTLHNIANAKVELADLDEVDEIARAEVLQAAVADCRDSLAERTIDDSPVEAGRTWNQLGGYLRVLGDDEGAVVAYRESLSALTPSVAPRHARDAAVALADLETVRGRWEEAAGGWEIAAEAAARAWQVRVTAAGRLEELRANVNIFRWAAYALAKVGRAERAIEILELGRGRELLLWLEADREDIVQLREYGPELAARYEFVRRELRRFDREQRRGIHVPVAKAAVLAEELAALRREIRAIPGLDSLHEPLEFSSIVAPLEPEDALVYLLNTPDGSVALVVTSHDGAASVAVIEAPEITSSGLVPLFLGPDAMNGAVAGYFTAHRSGSSEELEEALERFAEALAPTLLRRLTEALRAAGVSRVCLVPVSLLGLLPLHALSWEDGGTRCLLDDFDVAYAPSAAILTVCRRRAVRSRASGRAVVVGNPLPQEFPLPGAEFEAELVAQALGCREIDLLLGEEATKERVVRALEGAELVHLACHGAASIFGRPLDAALSFADNEPLYAEEILELDGFSPRLVVVSACETGVIQGYETADEALTLGATFVAAGAAAVISTLWSVDDLAAALLMSRFYDEIAVEIAYPTALRRAQLWLRDTSAEELDAYVAARPALRERYRSSRRAGQRSRSAPFSAITNWGTFIFTGA